jgi:hypothetical protein
VSGFKPLKKSRYEPQRLKRYWFCGDDGIAKPMP